MKYAIKLGRFFGIIALACGLLLLAASSVSSAPPLQHGVEPLQSLDSPNALSVVNIWLVSVSSAGEQGNLESRYPSISADGRYVAFDSYARNLVPDDTNNFWDVFAHDRMSGQTTRVSVSSSGVQGNGDSGDRSSGYGHSISGDGRYVAFVSSASNLVLHDTNNRGDVFVHDRLTGQTSRVSVSSIGEQGNDWSGTPSISANGRYVAFVSSASNLVANDTNNTSDVFLHDRVTGQTSRVSVSSTGLQGNSNLAYFGLSISSDGRYVVFTSFATNLVPGDTNNRGDVFVHDRVTGQTSRVSVSSNGVQGNGLSNAPSISADGRYVAFASGASNLVPGDTNSREDVFVRDRVTGQTSRVSVSSNGVQGNGLSNAPSISADGRYVAFDSSASNLVLQDTNNWGDVFVHDRLTGQTSRVSVSAIGEQGNRGSGDTSISGDGRYVAFTSSASNLMPGDTNSRWDVLVVELNTGSSPTPINETLATFNPSTGQASLLNTLSDQPASGAYNNFSPSAPIQGQWVMGDWDGNGTDTPAVFANGAVYLTNTLGPTTNWSAHWIGPAGTLVAGRFNPALAHDCLGVVEQAFLDPFTVFVLYYACDFTTNTPTVTWHWMSAALYDTASLPGLAGAWQFAIGDWNGNGAETPAIRRGPYVAFSNVPIVDANFAGTPPFSPNNTGAEFVGAQYVGAPYGAEYGQFVTGDWNGNVVATFGLFYSSIDHFFYYNNLDFQPGTPSLQRITNAIGNPRNVVSWRPAQPSSLTADIEQPLQALGDASSELESFSPLELLEPDSFDLQPLD